MMMLLRYYFVAVYTAAVTHNAFRWARQPPQILPLLLGGSGPPSNKWFLGPTRVNHQNGILICSAILEKLMNVTNRQTDRHREITLLHL